MVNCTLRGNTTDGKGGAIRNGESPEVKLTVRHCTFAGNTAGEVGGSIANLRGTMELGHTILSGSLPSPLDRVEDTFVSLGFNLSDTAIPELNGGDRINVPVLLGELRMNGGSVPTYATLDGSPVRDSGAQLFNGNPTRMPVDGLGLPVAELTLEPTNTPLPLTFVSLRYELLTPASSCWE